MNVSTVFCCHRIEQHRIGNKTKTKSKTCQWRVVMMQQCRIGHSNLGFVVVHMFMEISGKSLRMQCVICHYRTLARATGVRLFVFCCFIRIQKRLPIQLWRTSIYLLFTFFRLVKLRWWLEQTMKQATKHTNKPSSQWLSEKTNIYPLN